MLSALLEAILEPIFEVVVRLPGYLILRCFRRRSDLDLESARVMLTGLLFWATVGTAVGLAVWLA
jgi:hypothetical protein